MSPHELEMGFPMPLQFNWTARTTDGNPTPRDRLSRAEAQDAVRTLERYRDLAQGNIAKAQERMRTQANRHRREPDFDVGDCVFIVKKVWSTTRPSDKLDFPLTRQHYRIEGKSGHSYVLEVPPG